MTNRTQQWQRQAMGFSADGYQPQPYRREADETVLCPGCGAYNEPDARYCDQCGAPLAGQPNVTVLAAEGVAARVLAAARKLQSERGLSQSEALAEIARPGETAPKTSTELAERAQWSLAEQGIHPGQPGYLLKFRERAETIRNAYQAERVSGPIERGRPSPNADGSAVVRRMSELQRVEGMSAAEALIEARAEQADKRAFNEATR